MAKKGNRILVTLECISCGARYYQTTRNRINTTEPLILKKFCPEERKQTEHKEVKSK